jgi:glycosyltransferase involved in cell wall biosynthesis
MTGKKIKIAQVLAGAPKGGAENFYTRIVCELAKESELEQHAFTRHHTEREQRFRDAKVPVSTFKFGSVLHWLDRIQYRRALNTYRPDIVVTYMNRATTVTPKGDYKLVARLGHYYDLKYYQHCDYWIGNTKDICDYIISNGFPSDRVSYIPNFVNESIESPIARNSFNTPDGTKVLLALGRLHHNKGFDTLISAMARLTNDAVLWLAGEGPEEDKLKALVKSLDIENKVKFLGWRTDVNALMTTADLFICPSRHEGLGNIIIEAWFNKCPIISTASQGPKELIEDEKTGLLSPIDDPVALAEKIDYLVINSDKAKDLADRGYVEYQNSFSRDIIVKKYIDMFKLISDEIIE